jgi:hypothetical protein
VFEKLITDLNLGILLHLNSEEDLLFPDPKYGIDAAGLGFESR